MKLLFTQIRYFVYLFYEKKKLFGIPRIQIWAVKDFFLHKREKNIDCFQS